ncbi:MAG: hypothetical protein EXQ58_02140 [Acidobacteria bacterium]|nr:hypothetical protein [Acidobacteriota bacterium]
MGSRATYGSKEAVSGRLDEACEEKSHLSFGCNGRDCIAWFVQTHVHLCQTIVRGAADHLALLDWLKQRIWPFEAAHDERSLKASAQLGLAELIRGGTTTVLFIETIHHTDIVFEEARRSDLRAIVGKCFMYAERGAPKSCCSLPGRHLVNARHPTKGGTTLQMAAFAWPWPRASSFLVPRVSCAMPMPWRADGEFWSTPKLRRTATKCAGCANGQPVATSRLSIVTACCTTGSAWLTTSGLVLASRTW